MEKENMLYKFNPDCACNKIKNHEQLTGTKQRLSKHQNEDLICSMEQRTFISFSTDIVCILAFIFFGSVIFWFAITRLLVDCLRKTYNSDRCTKILVAVILTILFLSITTRVILNKRNWKHRLSKEKFELSKKNTSEAVANIPTKLVVLPSKPGYLQVTFKDKQIRNLMSENKTDVNVPKKFTVTIVDERKKEIFKTSKNFHLPELAPEMKNPPSLIVSLKDIVLENY